MLRTRARKEKIMAEAKIEITEKDWGRVWAKAMLEARKGDSSFKTTLEKNPLLAVRQFREKVDPHFPNPAKLIDDIKEYEENIKKETGVKFSDTKVPELDEIIAGRKKVRIGPNKLEKA
jgi:hypothetical protein